MSFTTLIARPARCVAAAAFLLPSAALAQTSVHFDLSGTAPLEATGVTSAGPLTFADSEVDVAGGLSATLRDVNGTLTVRFTGDLRLENFFGRVEQAGGPPLARVGWTGVRLAIVSQPGALTETPNGDRTFDVTARARYVDGVLRVLPPGGPAASLDLAGSRADMFQLRGRLRSTNDGWRLVAPIELDLAFGDPSTFGGGVRLTGALRGDDPCRAVQPFCGQGDGAPRLALLPSPGVDGLRFAVTEAAADAAVALIGGQRDMPMTAPGGSLCIGRGRRVLGLAQTGPAGAAQILWEPGPAGAAALSSGRFAVQALVQGTPIELTNALALERCR